MGGVDHVVPLDDLLALAAFGLAEGAFGGVEVVPAFPGGDLDALGLEVVEDGLVVAVFGGGEGAVAVVVEKHGGGVLGVGLGVADQADGAALDPAGGVQARDDVAAEFGEDVAFVVGDDGAVVVERHAVDGVGAVADGEVQGREALRMRSR